MSGRLSTSSSSSSSPVLSALDSSSHLILVHDDEGDSTPLDFELDDPENEDQIFDVGRQFLLPLSPPVVLLYLLSPLLKLGALLFPHTQLSLKLGLPAFFVFAILTAFSRRIWFMLSRYLRKGDLEDVVLDVFGKGRGKEKLRTVLRIIVRGGTGTLRVLLSALYFHDSIGVLASLFPSELSFPPNIILTIILGIAFFPLSLGQSLASKRTVYCTGFSVISYSSWLCLICIAHAQGTLKSWSHVGTLWSGISIIAFAFTSSATLTLYGSLKASLPPSISTVKASKSHSFMILSIASVFLAVVLTLPPMVFSAFPNQPRVQGLSVYPLDPYIASLKALTLLTGIPSLIVTSPALPIPERLRQSTNIPLSRLGLYIIVIIISLLPRKAFAVFSDITLGCALLGTYFLPALVHITAHYFKRPLTIVIPPSTPTPGASSTLDDLLQRKERALQRKQLRKRIIWDLGVWFLLLPVGGGGLAWAVGRLTGHW